MSLHLVPDSSAQDRPAGDPTAETCSFCEKPRADVRWLVAGPEQRAICDGCIALSAELVGLVDAPPPPPPLDGVLAEGVVGQEGPLAVLQRLLERTRTGTDDRAPVALLVGPPGTGKSHAADLIVRHAGLPARHVHTSRLSAIGYIGEQIGNMVLELGDAAPGDVTAGVLVFDGVEGMGRPAAAAEPRQVDGEDVQMELLALLDDTPVSLPRAPARPVQTRRLLRLLVATLDPLPPDEDAIRDALAAQGLLPGVLARVELVLPFPRRSAETLAPLAADLPLTDDARRALLEAAAAGDGAWRIGAVRAECLARGADGPVDVPTLAAWGLS